MKKAAAAINQSRMSTSTVIDKAVAFIKPLLDERVHLQRSQHARPIVIGVEGPQGSGKTYSSIRIKQDLSEAYPNFNIIQFSMDDFYLTYEQQLAVNSQNEGNVLLQGRGLPGTHDVSLLLKVFEELLANDASRLPIQIPVYDKSAHNGKGDRQEPATWTKVDKLVDLIIFEGWFNGYMSISNDKNLIKKWHSIKKKQYPKFENITDLQIVNINRNLGRYEAIWKLFDLFICIKTSEINNVYKWRLQQEYELIRIKGRGMSDADVEQFIDRYMPIYYLYYDRLEVIQKQLKSLELNIDESRTLLSSKF